MGMFDAPSTGGDPAPITRTRSSAPNNPASLRATPRRAQVTLLMTLLSHDGLVSARSGLPPTRNASTNPLVLRLRHALAEAVRDVDR
jgi:hypothetical protein